VPWATALPARLRWPRILRAAGHEGHWSSSPNLGVSRLAHDWTITSPAIGNKPDGVIVVTCSACGESGTFAAIPDRLTGRRVDLDGVCVQEPSQPEPGRSLPAGSE